MPGPAAAQMPPQPSHQVILDRITLIEGRLDRGEQRFDRLGTKIDSIDDRLRNSMDDAATHRQAMADTLQKVAADVAAMKAAAPEPGPWWRRYVPFAAVAGAFLMAGCGLGVLLALRVIQPEHLTQIIGLLGTRPAP